MSTTDMFERPAAIRYRGELLLLGAALLWSLNGLLIKRLYAGGVDGASIACYRSLFAAIFLLPIAVRRKAPIPDKGWVVAAVFLFTGMCVTFVVATTLTSAANAIILQYTAPVWVFLLSPWLVGDRATRGQWGAFVVSLSAVGLIFGAQYATDWPGLLVGLISGLVFGCQGVAFRRVRRVDPVMLAFLSCAVSGVLLLPVAMSLSAVRDVWPFALTLALMGMIQFALPYVMYSAGVRTVTAQRAVLLIMLEPVLNPIWVLMVQGEVPHWSTIVGGTIILISVGFLMITGLRADHRHRRGPGAIPPDAT